MAVIISDRRRRGFMSAQQLQKLQKPAKGNTLDEILAKLRYRLDRPRFIERDESRSRDGGS